MSTVVCLYSTLCVVTSYTHLMSLVEIVFLQIKGEFIPIGSYYTNLGSLVLLCLWSQHFIAYNMKNCRVVCCGFALPMNASLNSKHTLIIVAHSWVNVLRKNLIMLIIIICSFYLEWVYRLLFNLACGTSHTFNM